MHVTNVIVNTGQLPRETGFGNARLDNVLGPINKGQGQRFAYAFQITFRLAGLTGNDVRIIRRVTHKTTYTDKWTPAQQVIDVMARQPFKLRAPNASEDSPNPGNIKREPDRIVVQDGPGPSFGINDSTMYPMAFEGKFIILAQTLSGSPLASAEYYVCLLKRTAGAQNIESHFELLQTTIVPPQKLTIRVQGMWPDDSLQLEYEVRSRSNAGRVIAGTLGPNGTALVHAPLDPTATEIRFPHHGGTWSAVRPGQACMLPGGRYTFTCT